MSTTPDTDRILDDLRRVVDDAESLLRETSGLVGERAAEVRERARDAARDTEHYVRRNPWQAVGIAAGVGLLLGVLISRR